MGIGAFYALAWLALQYLGADHEGAQHGCIVSGPFLASPPYVAASESAQVYGHFSWFPLGRACSWEQADGFITVLPDWSGTIPMLALLAIVMAGAALFGLSFRRRA